MNSTGLVMEPWGMCTFKGEIKKKKTTHKVNEEENVERKSGDMVS